MQYRLATSKDHAAITEFLPAIFKVDPATAGGNWLVAVTNEGKVRGTIWEFDGHGNAYIDYWAADTPLIGATLAALMEARLRALGVNKVWAVMLTTGKYSAERLAEAFQMEIVHGYGLAMRTF